jgi:3-deoxy-7-phosphoheptulonate synthase
MAGRSEGTIGPQEGHPIVTTQPMVHNRRIRHVRPLVSPRQLQESLPLSASAHEAVVRGRQEVVGVLNGDDDRLLVIVGPCSLHDPVAGLEYAQRLAEIAKRLTGQLCVVMRTYFEKPRTTVGWKGLINDPHLDGSFAVNEGLSAARGFLLQVLELGLPVGCEFLDPITAAYLADTVSWGAIGARTTQSQIHRQLASGLSMPIGFKNTIDGDVQSAIDAVTAASEPQVFPGIDDDGHGAIFETSGNRDGHIVLRGSTFGPNYDSRNIALTMERLERMDLPRRVIVDASHANSGKDHINQAKVATEIGNQVASGGSEIVGIMLESFLVAGRQEFEVGREDHLEFGQSITDACLGWDATVDVLNELANAVARCRERSELLVVR